MTQPTTKYHVKKVQYILSFLTNYSCMHSKFKGGNIYTPLPMYIESPCILELSVFGKSEVPNVSEIYMTLKLQ